MNSPPKEPATPSSRPGPSKRKFKNGWTKEIEKLMAEWADKAVCYRWMHEKTERTYMRIDLALMFPVIILSTVTGAANFALDSVITEPTMKGYAQLGLGGMSILTGIISTIANRLAYASGSEAHKGAGLLWGKFQRLITIELSLHPDERSECMFFLKMCRAELDRLIERSPSIPERIIYDCRQEFAKYPAVRVPEIIGQIGTTAIYNDTDSRLKKLAVEAAITIAQKKKLLSQMALDDLEPRITRIMESAMMPKVMDEIQKGMKSSKVSPVISIPPVKPEIIERRQEVTEIAKSGIVTEMRRLLLESNSKIGQAPPGIGLVSAPIPSVLTLNVDAVEHVIPEEETQIYVDICDEGEKATVNDSGS